MKNKGWKLYTAFSNRILEITAFVIYIVCALFFTFVLSDVWKKWTVVIFRENYLLFSHCIILVVIMVCIGSLLTILHTLYDSYMDLKILFVLTDNEYLTYLLAKLKSFFFFFHAAFQFFIIEGNPLYRIFWNMVFLAFLGISVFFLEKYLRKIERRGGKARRQKTTSGELLSSRLPTRIETILLFIKRRYLVLQICIAKIGIITALLFFSFWGCLSHELFFILTVVLSLFLILCHDEYYKKFMDSMKLYALLNVPFHKIFWLEIFSGFLFSSLFPIVICGVYCRNINYVMILTFICLLENIFWSIVYINYGCTHKDGISVEIVFLCLGYLLTHIVPIFAVFVGIHLMKKTKYIWGKELT